jgi:plastocyanin
LISKKQVATLFFTGLSMIVLAGCGSEAGPASNTGSSGTATGDAQIITITARDDLFDPKNYTVDAGKPIKITVTNSGQNVHEVEVEDLFPETKLSPGQSKSLDITSATAGTYKLYCEIHEDTGMVGEFIVK